MQEHRRRGRVMTLAIALAAGSLLLGPAALISIPRYDFGRLARERPHVTAVMREAADRSVAEGTTIRRDWQWVPLGAMSPHVAPAFVAALDPAFYEHRGINAARIAGALRDAWRLREWPAIEKTLSQRLVQELVLGEQITGGEQIAQWVLTQRLERKLTKDRILEIYLNVMHWEGETYGVEGASQLLYGKSVRDLTLQQAALLAALHPIDGHSDLTNPDYRLRRTVVGTNLVLRRMQRAGSITEAEFEQNLVQIKAVTGL